MLSKIEQETNDQEPVDASVSHHTTSSVGSKSPRELKVLKNSFLPLNKIERCKAHAPPHVVIRGEFKRLSGQTLRRFRGKEALSVW
jgi:hypothetical protein